MFRVSCHPIVCRVFLCCFMEFGLCSLALSQPKLTVLKSPDANIVVTFSIVAHDSLNPVGQLSYAISFHGKPLILPSSLSLELESQPPLGRNVVVKNRRHSTLDENYHLLMGKASTVRNHYNEIRLDLAEPWSGGRLFSVEARAYNDAVAFRYVIPQQNALTAYRLVHERTEFGLSKDATCYALVLQNYRTMYESEYLKLSLSALSNQGGVESSMLTALPLLMEVPGVAWVAITEADLHDNPAMYLINPTGSWTGHRLVSTLPPRSDADSLAVSTALPHHSAWRVVLIGDEPGRLVESNAVTSLSPECALRDTGWIHPGKSSWDWWSGSIGPDGKGSFTTSTMKYYAEFSAQSGFPYVLIDAGWSVNGDITRMNGTVDIPAVVEYASSRNVKVWIWLHWADVDRQMREAFPLFQTWGVVGVKIDFMSRDDQSMIDFYYRVAELAAHSHLMVDFHGSTKPTGLERTYPNVVGYEGVLGMEQSKAGTRDNPDNHVMIPFTRMLAGPVDYTPGGFRNVTRETFEAHMEKPEVMGTRAHHLAMYVVYQAPFQMVSDCPSAYENQPGFQFIRDVATTWDETRVMNGMPGEYVTIARRHGMEWFLGSMTNWTRRRVEIPLGFLGDGTYTADIYADAPEADISPTRISVERRTVDRSMTIPLNLVPAGGVAIRFSPIKKNG